MSAERGSVLVLMPAAVLVLVVLAALAVDAAVVFTAQRELANAAAAAANDAAVAALDERAFYDGGVLVLDAGRAAEVAAASLAARKAGWLPTSLAVVVDHDPPRVRVHVEARVGLVFAPALPGGTPTRTVRASAVATSGTGGARS